MTISVTSEKYVKVTPEQAYYAFTHAIVLHDWLCDFATVAPRPGGRMYLWWHGDFYSAGEYLALEENKSVKFKWFSKIDPAPSEVQVDLIEQKDGTLVRLTHTVPEGEGWKERAESFKAEWSGTLENLAAVLETGLDKRTFDRPMLGISINDFNPEIAKSLGVPVKEGIRLAEVRDGFGAKAAGLTNDDVIVQLNGKPITNDFSSLVQALQGKKGGDKVEVVFYRGPERKTVTMELTKRPVPPILWDPKELAQTMRARYDEALAALEAALKGVSESEANARPAPSEWSAKEVLAHLVHTERGTLANLDDAVGGYERLSDDWGGNIDAHLRATIAAYPTVDEMLSELRHLEAEMVAFLAALPPAFVARKSSYFTYAAQLPEFLSHTFTHIDQIKVALEAARKK